LQSQIRFSRLKSNQMGKQAGVLTVGVRSSNPSSARLQGAGPDLVLESLAELSEHFCQNHLR
jgi:phosphoglycolate phosphatase-like HAD superfamily hydrolase